MDELLAKRDSERRSKQRWIIAIDDGEIYWAFGGGYTPLRSNALKYESRWDAVEGIRGKLKSPRRWNIQPEPKAVPWNLRMGGGGAALTLDDIEQVWTGVLRGADARLRPSDGLVHAQAADDSIQALCGVEVGSWRRKPWPPRGGMNVCHRCAAEAESALHAARRRR